MGSRWFDPAAVDKPGSARTPARSRVTKGAGAPSPEVQAAAGDRDGTRPGWPTGPFLLAVQRRYGNRRVQRLVRPPGPRPVPVVQAKLALGPPGDRYEREADRVARQVADGVAARVPALLSMRRGEGGAVDPGVARAIGLARAGGRAIPEPVRASLERALGADLAGVRLHADDRADQLNRSLRSRAFTVGQDIFFRRGAYLPDRHAGSALLAHEVTHVIQQQGTTPADTVQCDRPEDFDSYDDALETPYGEHLHEQVDDPIADHVGRAFSQAQRNKIYQTNEDANGGQLTSDTDGNHLTLAPSSLVPHVDHRFPKSAGGSNSYANAAVLPWNISTASVGGSQGMPGETVG